MFIYTMKSSTGSSPLQVPGFGAADCRESEIEKTVAGAGSGRIEKLQFRKPQGDGLVTWLRY